MGRFSSAPAKAAKEDDRIVALRGQMRLCKQVLELFQSGILVLDEIDTILHLAAFRAQLALGGKVSLDFTTDKEAPGMRWLLPFHALDPFFCATGGQAVMEVKHSPTTIALLRKIELAVKRGCVSSRCSAYRISSCSTGASIAKSCVRSSQSG